MCHPWSLMEVRFNCCEISAADMEPFTSCLFANTSTCAFLRSCICVCVYVEDRHLWMKQYNVYSHTLCLVSLAGHADSQSGLRDYCLIVSCPDPTQLMQGEGVWCHKSKSLG